MIVVDASAVVAALVDSGATGKWAESTLRNAGGLAAPEIMAVEVTNVLRRAEQNREVDAATAGQAFADLQRLAVQLVPFPAIDDRVWNLRSNLTAYDASYVAAAEALKLPLATLDEKLSRAPGPTCSFLLPNP